MQILPSLLEYSGPSLEHKLTTVLRNKAEFKKFTGQTKLSLHLDFVLPQFAKDRSVMKSNGLESVFSSLQTKFDSESLNLSIHLMGDSEDLVDAYRFFERYRFNPKWSYLILVPEKYHIVWQNLITGKDSKAKVGIWLDLGQWDDYEFLSRQDYLLMTVLAGKSGQQLNPETKRQALETVRLNSKSRFILDGGWSPKDLEHQLHNVDLVSYSGFWKEFVL